MIDALSNISSLTQTNPLGSASATGSTDETAETQQGSFAQTLQTAATSMVDDLREAEDMSVRGISGEATTREVVDAVMTAERSLQTAMAIRDKVVSAYLEITKMPI
jgi:flagellar hook-basal body complex protein FliE